MFRPSSGHHQVCSRDTETYEELRTYMGSQWCYICIKMTLYKIIPRVKSIEYKAYREKTVYYLYVVLICDTTEVICVDLLDSGV